MIQCYKSRVQADSSRVTTLQFMCEYVDEYISSEGEQLHADMLHADMPQRPMFQFPSLAERINLMSNPTVLVEEFEIMAARKVLKGLTNVSNTYHDTLFRYGEDVFWKLK